MKAATIAVALCAAAATAAPVRSGDVVRRAEDLHFPFSIPGAGNLGEEVQKIFQTSLNITKQSLEEAAKEDPALAADIQSFLPILQTLGSEVGGILGKVFGSLHL